MTKLQITLLVGLVALASAACGSDDAGDDEASSGTGGTSDSGGTSGSGGATSSGGTGGSGGSGGGGGAAGANGQEPLYVVASGVINPNSYQTYLVTTPSLEPAEIDLEGNGIEFEGFVYPSGYGDAIFVPSSEAPTFTRFTADADGDLVEGDTISFQGVGSSSAPEIFVLSDTKAYAFDEANLTVFVWDPTEMKLTDTEIDISMLASEGETATLTADPDGARLRGDLLFVPTGWYDNVTYLESPRAGMLVIDTAQDEVVAFLEDDRCSTLQSSVVTEAGDMYFFPAATILDVNAADPDFPACALRILADETEFDDSYMLDVSAATGGRMGCCGTYGGGNTAYIQVLHEERTDITDRTQLFGSAHNDWRFWRLDLETGEAEEVTSYPFFATSGPNSFQAGGQNYASILTLEGESGGLFSDVERSTTLVDMTTEAEPRATISASGSLLFFSRLR